MRTILALWLLFLSLFTSGVSSALEFQCEIPNDTRYLRVEIPGREYLCEVSVTYEESGIREVKWYARHDTLFCSAQAYNLRDKYTDMWGYTCTTWPDRDGVDKLSPSQRAILDQRLKTLIAQGKQATPAYTITGVRATASALLDKTPGKMALQFFTDYGDFTEIIDDESDSWTIVTTIESMASQIDDDIVVDSALVHSVTDDGSLEVHTRLVGTNNANCYGTQTLTPAGDNGALTARTPHRYICNEETTATDAVQIENESETVTQ